MTYAIENHGLALGPGRVLWAGSDNFIQKDRIVVDGVVHRLSHAALAGIDDLAWVPVRESDGVSVYYGTARSTGSRRRSADVNRVRVTLPSRNETVTLKTETTDFRADFLAVRLMLNAVSAVIEIDPTLSNIHQWYVSDLSTDTRKLTNSVRRASDAWYHSGGRLYTAQANAVRQTSAAKDAIFTARGFVSGRPVVFVGTSFYQYDPANKRFRVATFTNSDLTAGGVQAPTVTQTAAHGGSASSSTSRLLHDPDNSNILIPASDGNLRVYDIGNDSWSVVERAQGVNGLTDFLVDSFQNDRVYVGNVVVTRTQPPSKPVITTPTNNSAHAVSVPLTIAWLYAHPTDRQKESFELRRRVGTGAYEYYSGTGTWQSSNNKITVNAVDVTLPAGWGSASDSTHYYSIRTWAQGDVGPSAWSDEIGVVTADAASIPVIDTPDEDGLTFFPGNINVEWSVNSQRAYRIRLFGALSDGAVDANTVVSDTGRVESAARTARVNLPAANKTYYISLTVENTNGITSVTAVRRVETSGANDPIFVAPLTDNMSVDTGSYTVEWERANQRQYRVRVFGANSDGTVNKNDQLSDTNWKTSSAQEADVDLPNEETYYWISLRTRLNNNALSTELLRRVFTLPEPPSVPNVTVTANDILHVLSVQLQTTTGGAPSRFELQRRVTGHDTVLELFAGAPDTVAGSVVTKTFVDYHVASLVDYEYRGRSTDDEGVQSDWSAWT